MVLEGETSAAHISDLDATFNGGIHSDCTLRRASLLNGRARPSTPVCSTRLCVDVCCLCATAAGDAIVLGCADATLRIFSPTFDEGDANCRRHKVPGAKLERSVQCVGGAPIAVGWLRNVQAFVSVEPANCMLNRTQTPSMLAHAHANVARLYLNCWDATQLECASTQPVRPKVVHLPPLTGYTPGVWRCHTVAAAKVNAAPNNMPTGPRGCDLAERLSCCLNSDVSAPLSIIIPTNRIPITCAATSATQDDLILAGTGGVLVYHVGWRNPIFTTHTAGCTYATVAVAIELLCVLRLSMLPRHVDMCDQFIAVAFATEAIALRLRRDDGRHMVRSSARQEPRYKLSQSASGFPEDCKDTSPWAQEASWRALTLPSIPSPLLSSVPFHDPLNPHVQSCTAPTSPQQRQWTKQDRSAPAKRRDDAACIRWNESQGHLLSNAMPSTEAVLKAGATGLQLFFGNNSAVARVDWVYLMQLESCAGLHTIHLLQCSAVVPLDEGLGCKDVSPRSRLHKGHCSVRCTVAGLLAVGVREAHFFDICVDDMGKAHRFEVTRYPLALSNNLCHASAVDSTRGVLACVSVSSCQLQLWSLCNTKRVAAKWQDAARILSATFAAAPDASATRSGVHPPALMEPDDEINRSSRSQRSNPTMLASYSLPYLSPDLPPLEVAGQTKAAGVLLVSVDWGLVLVVPVLKNAKQGNGVSSALECASASAFSRQTDSSGSEHSTSPSAAKQVISWPRVQASISWSLTYPQQQHGWLPVRRACTCLCRATHSGSR